MVQSHAFCLFSNKQLVLMSVCIHGDTKHAGNLMSVSPLRSSTE